MSDSGDRVTGAVR